ncbi:hypothetical protein LguiA_029682 [Lonicera macranthoides]
MRIFAAAAPGIIAHFPTTTSSSSLSSNNPSSNLLFNFPKSRNSTTRRSLSSSSSFFILKVSSSSSVPVTGVKTEADEQIPPTADDGTPDQNTLPASAPGPSPAEISADWETARTFLKKGLICKKRIIGFNGGGLRVCFHSLTGFLPFPELSPSHICKEPLKSVQELARDLRGSLLDVKVIQADEENNKLVFSEKEASWSKFSQQFNVGDICETRVGSVQHYGAFLHLRFPDGCYHLTGLVHISEVSWDAVQDVRSILKKGDEVRAKIIRIDRKKSRITLSLKQLEEDPLLETLDKVISQNGSLNSNSSSTDDISEIEPLPGLETIIAELLQENGIYDITITREGFEKRVVSQDLQLWLSNAPPIGDQFTLLVRAGRQVQEIQMTTTLDQEGVKAALQKVLERVP